MAAKQNFYAGSLPLQNVNNNGLEAQNKELKKIVKTKGPFSNLVERIGIYVDQISSLRLINSQMAWQANVEYIYDDISKS